MKRLAVIGLGAMTALALQVAPGAAQAQSADPPGLEEPWFKRADGRYQHRQSRMICPEELDGGYRLDSLRRHDTDWNVSCAYRSSTSQSRVFFYAYPEFNPVEVELSFTVQLVRERIGDGDPVRSQVSVRFGTSDLSMERVEILVDDGGPRLETSSIVHLGMLRFKVRESLVDADAVPGQGVRAYFQSFTAQQSEYAASMATCSASTIPGAQPSEHADAGKSALLGALGVSALSLDISGLVQANPCVLAVSSLDPAQPAAILGIQPDGLISLYEDGPERRVIAAVMPLALLAQGRSAEAQPAVPGSPLPAPPAPPTDGADETLGLGPDAYLLLLLAPGEAAVIRGYTAQPSMLQVASDLSRGLDGDLPPLAIVSLTGDGIQVNIDADQVTAEDAGRRH